VEIFRMSKSIIDPLLPLINATKVISKDGDALVVRIEGHGSLSHSGENVTISATNLKLFAKYLVELRALDYGRQTISAYKSQVRMFMFHLGPKKFANVTKDDLKSYLTDTLREKGLSKNTIRHHFAALTSLFDFLVDEEKLMPDNPMDSVQKYKRTFKSDDSSTISEKQVISVEEASRLVNTAFSSRDRAILTLGLKCGLRCHELCELNVEGVNLNRRVLKITPTPKRSYNYAFIDDELAAVLKRWIARRETILQRIGKKTSALFISERGTRLSESQLGRVVKKTAIAAGLCSTDPEADTSEKFSSHCMRYFFVTSLRLAGLPREHGQILRGDKIREAYDQYNRITMDELKREYFRCVPQLGVS
jgi:site-specific recombinase XerD